MKASIQFKYTHITVTHYYTNWTNLHAQLFEFNISKVIRQSIQALGVQEHAVRLITINESRYTCNKVSLKFASTILKKVGLRFDSILRVYISTGAVYEGDGDIHAVLWIDSRKMSCTMK